MEKRLKLIAELKQATKDYFMSEGVDISKYSKILEQKRSSLIEYLSKIYNERSQAVYLANNIKKGVYAECEILRHYLVQGG